MYIIIYIYHIYNYIIYILYRSVRSGGPKVTTITLRVHKLNADSLTGLPAPLKRGEEEEEEGGTGQVAYT